MRYYYDIQKLEYAQDLYLFNRYNRDLKQFDLSFFVYRGIHFLACDRVTHTYYINYELKYHNQTINKYFKYCLFLIIQTLENEKEEEVSLIYQDIKKRLGYRYIDMAMIGYLNKKYYIEFIGRKDIDIMCETKND